MFTMIFTVIQAVLPLAGVVLGGRIASRSALKQSTAENQRMLHREKLEAYSRFLSEYHSFILNASKEQMKSPGELTDVEMENGIRFSMAYSAASLVAPSSVRCSIKELYVLAVSLADGCPAQEAAAKYREVEELLHRDLLNI